MSKRHRRDEGRLDHEYHDRKRRKIDNTPTLRENSDRENTSQSEKKDVRYENDDDNGQYVFTIGEEIRKRYVVNEFLGDGTFSKVLKCFDRFEQTFVALKIIRSYEKYTDAAKCEIEILLDINQKCAQPHYCIQVFDYFVHKNHMCIVFPFMSCSIYDFLKLNKYNGFPVFQLREILKQLFIAVKSYRSLKIIHTDLKPENILLKDSSYKYQNGKNILYKTDIKLTDFGSAVYERTIHRSVVSTRHYRSPEVILDLGWDSSTDLWSLGCIIFELYTGKALFQTHDDDEHLAIIEHYVGRFPDWLVDSIKNTKIQKYFCPAKKTVVDRDQKHRKKRESVGKRYKYRLDWPRISRGGKGSVEYVGSLESIEKEYFKHSNDFEFCDVVCNSIKGSDTVINGGKSKESELANSLFELMMMFLKFDRNKRITIEKALEHKFFKI